MKKHLLEYAQYNLWANELFINHFRNTADALIEAEVVSSFPSIRKTMMHLWDVEVLWLARLNGISPTEFPSKNFNGSNAEVYDNLLAASQAFVAFIEDKPAPFFRDKITYRLIVASGEFTQTVTHILLHFFNHQTMHRGQLITMCRQLNILPIPNINMLTMFTNLK